MAGITTWSELVEVTAPLNMSEEDLVKQAEKLGVDVPNEVKNKALVGSMMSFADSKNQPDRKYLKTKGFPIGKSEGKAQFAKGLFLETRAIDLAIEVLTAAREEAQRQGYATSPTEG